MSNGEVTEYRLVVGKNASDSRDMIKSCEKKTPSDKVGFTCLHVTADVRNTQRPSRVFNTSPVRSRLLILTRYASLFKTYKLFYTG